VPRRYRMGTRAAAVEETRRRLVEASKELHAEQGILGTSYEEIARRAGVAPATVYRHFPTLNDLLPACARSIQVLRPLTMEQAAETFRGMSRPALRLEALVRGTCECYARDQGWLQAARREEELLPALRDVAQVQRDNLRLLVGAALAGTGASARTAAVIAALIDFPVWQAFRDMGLGAAETADQLLELVRDRLDQEAVL
jgi:AcrR family transcriptional regulator